MLPLSSIPLTRSQRAVVRHLAEDYDRPEMSFGRRLRLARIATQAARRDQTADLTGAARLHLHALTQQHERGAA